MQSFSRFQHLPATFTLQNLAISVGKTFPLQCNVHLEDARESIYPWYEKFGTHKSSVECAAFLEKSRFDSLSALSFPAANQFQLEACLMFYLWAFVVDDLADEGEGQADTEAFERLTRLSMDILLTTDREVRTTDPYANMLKDIIYRLRLSERDGMVNRFIQGFDDWSSSQIAQSNSRTTSSLPSVEEFIVTRRKTFGTLMATSLVEYTLDLDLPQSVMDNAIVKEMIESLFDTSIWANDLCSFNKEQAQGDYQNLVCIIMEEHDLDLQSAIDRLAQMVDDRLKRYQELKLTLPSFDKTTKSGLRITHIDEELNKFFEGCEVANVGIMAWWYESPRYFRDVKASTVDRVSVTLFERETKA